MRSDWSEVYHSLLAVCHHTLLLKLVQRPGSHTDRRLEDVMLIRLLTNCGAAKLS